MANPTTVDIEGMKRAQSTFQTALDECTASYASVEGQLEALAPAWQSTAASIYSDSMAQWLQDFRNLNRALDTMLQSLAANTGVYANTHENTKQVANQVKHSMSGGNFGGLPGFPS